VIFVLFFLLYPLSGIAQWQPDVRLTNDTLVSRTSFGNAWCVSAASDAVHVVWFTQGTWPQISGWYLYYKRSTDGGVTWSPDTMLSNRAFTGIPSVSASGSIVHVVFEDNRDGNSAIYYKRSTNAGLSWSADLRLTASLAHYPSISVSGSLVHVVCRGYSEIIYKRSTDGGITWSADIPLTYIQTGGLTNSISASGQLVHVTWFDNRAGNEEIYYKRSSDAGATWGLDVRLTYDTSISYDPRIASSGSDVHVFWQDYRRGTPQMYYKRSTDGGLNWGADTPLTYTVSSGTNPAASGSNVHVVWTDEREVGNPEIYYMRSTDSGINWDPETRLTYSNGNSYGASVAASGISVHVLWHDNRDGNYEIYYKRNPTGNPIGIKSISHSIPGVFQLYQNFPNPFNPSTRIKFDLPYRTYITLSIYNVLGQQVEILIDSQLNAGTYETEWISERYPSGIYYYVLSARGPVMSQQIQTRKMVLIR